MNLSQHFKSSCNNKRVHIEQLRILRDDKSTDEATRKKLDKQIEHERHQLSVLDEIWDVS